MNLIMAKLKSESQKYVELKEEDYLLLVENTIKVGSINSIFYFLHKAAEPFNCLEQDNLA